MPESRCFRMAGRTLLSDAIVTTLLNDLLQPANLTTDARLITSENRHRTDKTGHPTSFRPRLLLRQHQQVFTTASGNSPRQDDDRGPRPH